MIELDCACNVRYRNFGDGVPMCGVFGWLMRSGRRPGRKALELTDLMIHRGPDDAGHELLEICGGTYSLGLGHRRLSIIDLSHAAAQPMWSADEAICVTFNGQIYNYLELRDELIGKGHRFRTTSDTEVLIEAYRAWGKDAVRRFRGMFAFALYDARDQTVLFARDAFGKKPLFLYQRDGDLVFSSEIEPITHFPGFDRTFDWAALEEYLLDRYVPGPRTFFRAIRKLQPGCLAHWRAGALTVERYYTPPLATVRPDIDDYEEALRLFKSAFDEAVRLRMYSDAPYGAFLSGGLDSSAIVAVMTRHAATPVKTFCVGFPEEEYSELGYSEGVARHFGADHTSLLVTPDDFFSHWDEAILRRGAPVSEASDIPILILSRLARNHVKMVLTGEGADEFLAGYPKHQAERYAKLYQCLVPAAIHDRLVGPLAELLPYGMRRLKVLAKAFGQRNPKDRLRIWFGDISTAERKLLLGRPGCDTPLNDFPFLIEGVSDLRRVQFFDQTSWLPDNALERGDRMMMGGSIEGRMPFMDVNLARLVARFPDSFLVRRGSTKAILRSSMKGVLPPSVLHRKKNGFRVPVNNWFRTSHSELVRELLTSRQSSTRRLLNGQIISSLVESHVAGRSNNERILWSLANLERFLRIYKPDLGTALSLADTASPGASP